MKAISSPPKGKRNKNKEKNGEDIIDSQSLRVDLNNSHVYSSVRNNNKRKKNVRCQQALNSELVSRHRHPLPRQKQE